MNWWSSKGRPASPSSGKGAPSGDLAALWAAAFKAHQAGQLADAARLYRQVLGINPAHFDSWHLLGVACLQQGRLEEAREHIARAVGINPRNAAAHGNLGTALLRSGLLAQARASLQTALQLDPKNAGAASTLGTVLMREAQPAQAAAQFRKALALGADPGIRNELAAALLDSGDAAGAARECRALLKQQPGHAAAHNNLALALERSGQPEAALQEYARALALDAGLDSARVNRATLLASLGRTGEAKGEYDEAIRLKPQSAVAHANLGALLRNGGDPAGALPHLRQALAIDPRLLEAGLALAQATLEVGDLPAAASQGRTLLKEFPRSAEVHAVQASIEMASGRIEETEACARRALALDPGLAQAHQLLALSRMAVGDAKGAAASHAEAMRLGPLDAAARWGWTMAQLPVMFESAEQIPAARNAFADALAGLENWFGSQGAGRGFAAVGSTQPFYLAYQPGNHRELLDRYGKLCAHLMASHSSAAGALPPEDTRGRRIRVGIVSAHVQDHSVWNAIARGWLEHLDRGRFELLVFGLGAVRDGQSQLAHKMAHRMESGLASTGEWVKRIRAAAPDVLIYTEIGMDPVTTKLASMRLAGLQLATWGHPLTSGLPTIDGYLSAAALEPTGAQAHYTEELVQLPGLGVCYQPLQVQPLPVDRAGLGLPEDAPLLVCAGLPFKYLPQHDDVWVDIARRLPQARLVFFKAAGALMHGALEQRLRARFNEQGLDFDQHARFIRVLSRPEFFGLMRQAHVFLDTIGFSGFNTAMQAVECELPVVAYEGDALRGRFASGILRELGLEEWVATTTGEYVDRVVTLAKDEGERAAASAHMRRHRERLFGTTAPVRALEDFLESRIGAAAKA
ncbi:MAG: tetratricopeptide repeat protein [Burkholderiales bacterium]|nr:tetratricopeptide repeat protein [Burkholderiales bacterium]